MPKAPGRPIDRRALVAEAHAGWRERRGGTSRAVAVRAAFARELWAKDGTRRLPGAAALDRALGKLAPGDLEWICEFSPLAPIYLLPTRAWVNALARTIRSLGVKRVVEVAAGDGFVSRALRGAAPELDVVATDSGAWEAPEARMSARERRELRGRDVPGLALGHDVRRLEAVRAARELEPDLVLASWLPPGPLLDRLIRTPAKYVLDVGAAGGVTPGAWSWRFAHEFCEGPLEALARCRLDERPRATLHSRVTLYYAAGHPEHACERVRPGDWLWQFKPA